MYKCIKCGEFFSLEVIIQRKPTHYDFICPFCWLVYYPEEVESYIKRMPESKEQYDKLKLQLREYKLNKIVENVK